MGMLDGVAARLGAGAARNETLGWDRLRALAAEGVTLAPHSRTHPMLPTLTDPVLEAELAGARDDLSNEIDNPAPCVAYPSGAHDRRVVEATAAAGYELAFTTRRGVNDLRHGRWLTLRRINVGHRTTSTLLRAQIGSWMGIADRG